MSQDPATALIRLPGHRTYGVPVPASQPARVEWEFALLSALAYPPHDRERTPDGYPDFSLLLKERGWRPWDHFPTGALRDRADQVNLGVRVWQSSSDPAVVVVAFRGTLFRKLESWNANLRWLLRFIPGHYDAYSEIVGDFCPAFIEEYGRRMNQVGGEALRNPRVRLYATGHSLGGGLAQQFAYALPPSAVVPRVTQVYAFDPSPVTGYYSVEPKTRDKNAETLRIERTFEQGETLSYVRSALNLVYKPTATQPAITGVRYHFFKSWNPFFNHSMQRLAAELLRASGQVTSVPTSYGSVATARVV